VLTFLISIKLNGSDVGQRYLTVLNNLMCPCQLVIQYNTIQCNIHSWGLAECKRYN